MWGEVFKMSPGRTIAHRIGREPYLMDLNFWSPNGTAAQLESGIQGKYLILSNSPNQQTHQRYSSL